MAGSVLSWVEDMVSFRGVIRRSGNSLIATIPPELSQRFLIREGQEYTIVGMSRMNPDFEGALQIYLGFFTVLEKAPRVDLVVEDVGFPEVERVLKNHGAGEVVQTSSENGGLKCYGLFTAVEKNRVKIPKTVEEVASLLPVIKRELEERGATVKSIDVSEVVHENRQVDPAVISRSVARAERRVAWKWEI
ncbi:MAG: hypothetical protein NZ570_02830 [Candidatus Caldarchaeum sp.]|nr:hypothetical protein [Candidatus Caldarchaeum sp.]MDW8359155.1 hypothetical protein [Candidatus Caldarchaeum sp.]